MPRFIFPVLRILCLSFIATPSAFANSDTHIFGFYVKGIKAGTIQTEGTRTNDGYSVMGTVHPTSLMRRLRKIGYSGLTTGTGDGDALKPRTYNAQTQTGNRSSAVAMRFAKGKPQVDVYTPSREKRGYDVEPAAQKGTIDPLSAAHQVFRDQTVSQLCAKTIHMFDGRRRTKLVLANPTTHTATDAAPNTQDVTCAGTYTRVAGFSPADMQERVNFPFTLVYKRVDEDTYRLMSFATKTTFGSAKAVRK